MKKLKCVLVLMLGVLLAGCYKVPAGNVGVKFNQYGSDKGVQMQETEPGRGWLGWNQEMFIFPTFTQTYVWTKAGDDQSPNDESLDFQTDQGMSVNADVGITYHIDPAKVTTLFQTYRKGIDEITHVYLRNMVRDALVNEASKLDVEQVYGRGKSELLQAVQADVEREIAGRGIIIEKVYWIGNLRLPDTVTNSINAKIQATQMAQQRENEVAQATAEAQKEVAVAQGQAQSKLLVATAEAKSITLLGEAAKNSQGAVQLKWIEKWDGKLPATQLGSGTNALVNLPAAQ